MEGLIDRTLIGLEGEGEGLLGLAVASWLELSEMVACYSHLWFSN